jgi:hypothetical protein
MLHAVATVGDESSIGCFFFDHNYQTQVRLIPYENENSKGKSEDTVFYICEDILILIVF